MNYTLIIVIALLVIVALVVISIYNGLVGRKNRMQEAWSAIDVFLKKRFDLVPNLVETVKGYATHEKGIMEQITLYRSQAMKAGSMHERMESEAALGRALGNLLVAVENYPDLKANANFAELQGQLAELENDLSAARRYYNGTVREMNNALEKFPSNVVGGLFGFSKGEFFAADAAEKKVPQVKF